MGTCADGPPHLHPTRVRLGVLAFACTLSLLTYLDRICISQVQKDIQFDLRIDDVGMGLILGAFALGYGIFEVPGGWLGDRWGARRVLTGIVAWWSVFTALTGLADWLLGGAFGAEAVTAAWSFRLPVRSLGSLSVQATTILIVLVSVRFLFGCGEAGAYPNLTRVVQSWFPSRERGVAQGAIWMSARLGGAIAFVTIGLLTTLLGWRLAFVSLGLLGAAWCLAFFRWFRDAPEQKPSCNAAERALIREGAGAAPAHAHGLPPLRPLMTSVSLWAVSLSAFGVSMGWWFLPAYQPKYFAEVFRFGGGDRLQAAALAGLPFLCGAAGSLAGGRLSDWLVRRLRSRRWGRSLIGAAGFGGAGLCVLATGFVAEVWQAVALLSLASFINDLAIPPLWAATADVGGRFAGAVSGFMNMVGSLGAFLCMYLTPVVMNHLPATLDPAARWRLVFAGYACSWFVAALSWLFVDAGNPIFPEESTVRRP
jgi:MFS family permease